MLVNGPKVHEASIHASNLQDNENLSLPCIMMILFAIASNSKSHLHASSMSNDNTQDRRRQYATRAKNSSTLLILIRDMNIIEHLEPFHSTLIRPRFRAKLQRNHSKINLYSWLQKSLKSGSVKRVQKKSLRRNKH